MDMHRITARWTGFAGAPGYSNFFFGSGFLDGGLLGDEAEALAARVREAFVAVSYSLAPGVQVTISPDVAIIDSDTGVATDFVNIDQPAPVNAPGSGGYAGPAGAVVTWRTNDLRNGRRIRGRTFLVPLEAEAYQDDGTLVSGALEDLQDFGNALIGNALEGDFGVWSRPVGGSGGVFASVTGFTVPDMVAVLRSRRD